MSGKQIILMEDEPDIAWLVQRQLEKAGYQVSVAADGAAGLEEFFRSGADLVLLDVNMPGVNGWDAYARIRATSRVPVIMLTAYGEDQDPAGGLEQRGYSYLGKPFSTRELLGKIEALLNDAYAALAPEVPPGDT